MNNSFEFKIGDLIKYNYIYSMEEDRIGIVCDIKYDHNFAYIIFVLNSKEIEQVPYSIMKLK